MRLASTADVDDAVASATAAWAQWRDASIAKRQTVLFAFRELLNARKQELAEILTSEHGKVLSDALGEIARGMEVVEFACGLGHLTKGAYSENVSTGIDVYTLRQPLGVVGIISPFNFPAMVPLWFFSIALAAGNAVILKPSEKDPTAANWMAALLKEAGLPDGVLNVVHGDKEAVDAPARAPRRPGDLVRRLDADRALRLRDRDRSRQARAGARRREEPHAGASGCRPRPRRGRRRQRRLRLGGRALHGDLGRARRRHDRRRVRREGQPSAWATLRTGDGTRGCDMGPLITEVHRDKVASYIDVASTDGASVVVDGRDVEIDGDPDGFWLGPTLIDKVPTSSSVYRDEIFGPVLSVVRVDGYEEGLGIINGSLYGNGTAIFTNDGGAARRFQREVQVGMIGINVPIPVPVAYHSFGGWKASLFGDAKAYGPHGFDFFTHEKAVTSPLARPVARRPEPGLPAARLRPRGCARTAAFGAAACLGSSVIDARQLSSCSVHA